MELIGKSNGRNVFYCNVRNDVNWWDQITFDKWIAFTIVDNDDKEWLNEITSYCLDKNVCYTCSAGELASLTEDYFDGKYVLREIQKEETKEHFMNDENTLITTSHHNFSEGFWFAVTVVNRSKDVSYINLNEVVCIDCTKNKVFKHLINLVNKINKGWLPSDKEIEAPVYDNEMQS